MVTGDGKCDVDVVELSLFLSLRFSGRHGGESRVRQLRRDVHPAVETRRHGSLSL